MLWMAISSDLNRCHCWSVVAFAYLMCLIEFLRDVSFRRQSLTHSLTQTVRVRFRFGGFLSRRDDDDGDDGGGNDSETRQERRTKEEEEEEQK